jgi:hypothetical protein
MSWAHIEMPSHNQICKDPECIFNIRPCISQIKVSIWQLRYETDIIYISATGSGKTLTFWIPMIYEKDSITVLVTALNVLGQQTAQTLELSRIKVHMRMCQIRTRCFQLNFLSLKFSFTAFCCSAGEVRRETRKSIGVQFIFYKQDRTCKSLASAL